LFVAVYPPDEVRRDLRRHLIAAVGPGARLTPIERWHITLAFLGAVEAERLSAVQRALDLVKVPKGTELRLRGGGRFGRGRSTVLWAGVDGELGELRRDVCERLEMPDRDFTPHLTVAYRDDRAVRRALNGYAGPPWSLDEMALVRSVLGEGYTTVRSW
jgi:2'-5' RNA ligase